MASLSSAHDQHPVPNDPFSYIKSDVSIPLQQPDSQTQASLLQAQSDQAFNQQHINDRRQDRAERKIYASKLFWLVACWMLAVFSILLLQGFKVFQLENTVLVALLSTTSVNMIGLFVIVTKYLFSEKRIEHNGKD